MEACQTIVVSTGGREYWAKGCQIDCLGYEPAQTVTEHVCAEGDNDFSARQQLATLIKGKIPSHGLFNLYREGNVEVHEKINPSVWQQMIDGLKSIFN